MPEYQLIIGNKNYSSWSMRPWLLLAHLGQPFAETIIPLRQADSKARMLEYGPSGKVPLLKSPRVTVWDSLAIAEYLAEQFPGATLWPRDPNQRALARAVTAEMHGGFTDLRRELPMNLRRLGRPPETALSDAAQADIRRVIGIWQDCRQRFGSGGPMLFGKFSIVDAYYAPVVTRFLSYGVELPSEVASYCQAVRALPAVDRWYREAAAESWVINEIDLK